MAFTKPRNSFETMHGFLMRSISPKALMAAVELKVFDELESGPSSAGDLATRLGAVAERLETVLDILVAAGALEKEGDRYANTPMAAEFLVTASPLYQGLGMRLTMDFMSTVEDNIAELVTGGTVDRDKADDGWGAEDVMEGTAQDAMGSALFPVVETIAGLPGFGDFRHMCDIGGNHGAFTMGVLDRNEAMRGTIFDLPAVAVQAQARCDAHGYGDRIKAVGFDFRQDDLPRGEFDLALTSHVLYAFKDDIGKAVFRIAEGLRPGGWFVSHHYAGRTENIDPLTTASLELLTRLCGYSSHFVERDELEDALAGAGFADIRFQPAMPGGLGLITTARNPV